MVRGAVCLRRRQGSRGAQRWVHPQTSVFASLLLLRQALAQQACSRCLLLISLSMLSQHAFSPCLLATLAHRADDPQTLPPALGARTIKHIEALFDWAMPACLRLVRKEIKEISPTEDSNIART